jgi:hypothetical protein
MHNVGNTTDLDIKPPLRINHLPQPYIIQPKARHPTPTPPAAAAAAAAVPPNLLLRAAPAAAAAAAAALADPGAPVRHNKYKQMYAADPYINTSKYGANLHLHNDLHLHNNLKEPGRHSKRAGHMLNKQYRKCM